MLLPRDPRHRRHLFTRVNETLRVREYIRLTENDICFRSLLFQQTAIVEASQNNVDFRVRRLDFVCLLLTSNQSSEFVLRVDLAQDVKCISRDVACCESAEVLVNLDDRVIPVAPVMKILVAIVKYAVVEVKMHLFGELRNHSIPCSRAGSDIYSYHKRRHHLEEHFTSSPFLAFQDLTKAQHTAQNRSLSRYMDMTDARLQSCRSAVTVDDSEEEKEVVVATSYLLQT